MIQFGITPKEGWRQGHRQSSETARFSILVRMCHVCVCVCVSIYSNNKHHHPAWESRKRAELVQCNGTGGVIAAIHM